MDHFSLPPDSPCPDGPLPFYAELFAHLPVLVVRISAAGIVLDMSPAVTRVTGYSRAELMGRNWWSTLFPGKLFQQVPRFMSPRSDAGLFRDMPLTLRCRDGAERIIAWSRYARLSDWMRRPADSLHDAGSPVTASEHAAARPDLNEWVCIGTDLTPRLDDADRAAADALLAAPDHPEIEHGEPLTLHPEDIVPGDFIEPLAILPGPNEFAAKSTRKAIEDVERLLALAGENGGALVDSMRHAGCDLNPAILADLHARIAEITLMCGRGASQPGS